MKKVILAGVLGVLLGAGLLVTQGANAYNGTSCQGATIVPPITTPPVTNPVDNSTIVPSQTITHGSIHGPGGDEVVCADGFAPDTAGNIDGGAIVAGLTFNNGPNRFCVGPNEVGPLTLPVGAYIVIDGDNANTDPLDGYIGISNFETSSGNQNCQQGGGGGGSNSGGSFGVDGQPITQLPLPIVCGNTSGDDYGNTTRDGCYNP
jgi:hypothetical protein